MAAKFEPIGNLHRKLGELGAWTRLREEQAHEPELPIIDPHHHLWDDHRGRYMVDELLADTRSGHNIIATVYVETGLNYRTDLPPEKQPVGEVEFVTRLSRASATGAPRLCAGIVGHADLMLGERVEPVLESLIAAGEGRLRGIRHGVAWDANKAAGLGRMKVIEHQVLDTAFRQGLACLRPLGLCFESWQYYTQLPDLVDLLRAFPDTTIVLNHVGGLRGGRQYGGDKPEDVFEVWRGCIRALAPFPNLYVKLGGLGMPSCGWDFHLRDIPPSSEELAAVWHPFIETCIEAFGPERCMFESNFPPDKQSCGYGVLWNAFKRITHNYSPSEKQAMYHDTAARVYQLDTSGQ